MPQGSANGAAILSEENVCAIRQLYLTGQLSFADLAQRFGLSKAAIQFVLDGRNWSHLLTEGEAEQLREVREERSTHRPNRRMNNVSRS